MNTRFSRYLSYLTICTVSLGSILLVQHQFVNRVDVGSRSRCCWPPYQTFLLSIQLFQMLNKVVQRTFLSSFSRKFIGSLNAFSKLEFNCFMKIISSTLKPIVLLFDHIGVVWFVVMATAAAGTLPY